MSEEEKKKMALQKIIEAITILQEDMEEKEQIIRKFSEQNRKIEEIVKYFKNWDEHFGQGEIKLPKDFFKKLT